MYGQLKHPDTRIFFIEFALIFFIIVSHQVAPPGFEPEPAEPESAVLPLHYGAIEPARAVADGAGGNEQTTLRNRAVALREVEGSDLQPAD